MAGLGLSEASLDPWGTLGLKPCGVWGKEPSPPCWEGGPWVPDHLAGHPWMRHIHDGRKKGIDLPRGAANGAWVGQLRWFRERLRMEAVVWGCLLKEAGVWERQWSMVRLGPGCSSQPAWLPQVECYGI